MPLTLLLFRQFPVISPLANAIAIPVVSMLVTPLALLGAAMPPIAAAAAAGHGASALAWLVVVLRWLASPEWAVWETAQAGVPGRPRWRCWARSSCSRRLHSGCACACTACC
ncbi:ComEC/Rec2 family competence protein [Cupriavidus basilensis]